MFIIAFKFLQYVISIKYFLYSANKISAIFFITKPVARAYGVKRQRGAANSYL